MTPYSTAGQMLTRAATRRRCIGIGGCDRLSNAPQSRSVLDAAENLTRAAQRALLAPRDALAPEYEIADLSSGVQAQWFRRP